MEGKTHIGIGLAAGAMAATLSAGPEGAEWLALAVGSVAPDWDGRESLGSKPSAWLPRFVPFSGLLDHIASFLASIPANMFGHRNTLHYPIFALGIWLAGGAMGLGWLQWGAVGWATHVVADSMTKQGVPWLGPFTRRNFGIGPRFMRLKTGGLIEWFVMTAVWLWVLGWAVLRLAGQV